MHPNMKPSEQVALVGAVDPDNYSANPYSTPWVDMSKFDRALAVVMVGTMESSSTVNAKIEQATTDGGTPKDVTGKAIAALTQAGTDSDKQAVINLKADDLDVDNGYRFARLTVTVAAAASDMAALMLGFNPRHAPASDHDAATVDEIVG
ncbi:MAG: hypothetical protein AB7O45_10560 [Alphaproteobacteria bacterium]